MLTKVWLFACEKTLIAVYSSEPTVDYLKSILKKRWEYLTDEQVKELFTKGWTTDGWYEWSLTKVEVENPE